jgi:hypothetical protein
MRKEKTTGLNLFFPITRVDEETRIVEGVAFANEQVQGDKRKLPASVLERATPDYMKFAAVREMHGKNAAGTALPLDPEIARQCGLFWEDRDGKRVAVLRSYISDDAALKKARDGTYKGYSVGVMPTSVRGNNVESCTWYETSLVDRPADPDALLSIARADGIQEEGECAILDDYTSDDDLLSRMWGDGDFEPILRAEDDGLGEIIERQKTKWTKEKRDALPVKNFAWPEKRKYPIEDQKDVDDAARLIGRAPEAMRSKIKSRIMSIAKRLDLKIPESWSTDASERTETDFSIMRGAFASMMTSMMPWRLRYMAFDTLSDAIGMIQSTTYADPSQMEHDVRTALDEFAEFIMPIVKDKSWPDADCFDDMDSDEDAERGATPTLLRLIQASRNQTFLERRATESEAVAIERLEKISTLERELSTANSELLTVQGLERAAREEVAKLSKEPQRRPPVRITEGIERKWGSMLPDDDAAEIKRLQDEHAGIMSRRLSMTAGERENASHRLIVLEQQITRLGGRVYANQ